MEDEIIKYVYSHIGYNLKTTDIQAAIGVEQLKKLNKFCEARRKNFNLWKDDWVETGLAAANFSLSEIHKDGTLNYWSNEQAEGLQQDTYHSVFKSEPFPVPCFLFSIQSIQLILSKIFNRKIQRNNP